MKTSPKGLQLIAGFEGCILRPYNDPAGFATIGVGHLIRRGRVTAGDQAKYKGFTRKDAMALLAKDVVVSEQAVNRALRRKVSQNQFDALVSLAFNVGGGAVVGSTLMRKLNAGDKAGAANEFLKWNMAGGRRLQGLTNRRIAERKLFLSGGLTPVKKTPLPLNWWKRYVYGDTDCHRSLLVKLAKVAKAHRTKIFVRSGNRTYAEQVVLYRHYQQYGHPLAARPGTSNHEGGRAADCQMNGHNIGDVISRAELKRYGLVLPVKGESWHVEEG